INDVLALRRVESVRVAGSMKAVGLVNVEHETTAQRQVLPTTTQATLHIGSVEQAEQTRVGDHDAIELQVQLEAAHIDGDASKPSAVHLADVATGQLEQTGVGVDTGDRHPRTHEWASNSASAHTELEHVAYPAAAAQVEVDVAGVAAME